MANFLISAAAFVVAIGVLVAVHEFGHFWVARRLGCKVVRFSIGFGRPLARWTGRAPDFTEYWLSSIPLGGYVKLLDEREAPVRAEERDRAFNQRPIPHRIAVLLAGPAFNFLFAIIAYWLMFVSGVPGVKPIIGQVTQGSVAAQAGLGADDEIIAVGDRPVGTWERAVLNILDELLATGEIDLTVQGPQGNVRHVELDVRGREHELTEPQALFRGLGIQPGPLLPAVAGDLTPGMPAERAGFERGDQVLSADGEKISSWVQWLDFVRARPGRTVAVTVLRDGEERNLSLTIDEAQEEGSTYGRIGFAENTEAAAGLVAFRAKAEERYGLFEALPRGLRQTWEISALTVRMLASMVVGDVSVRNISGPLNIAAFAGDSARAGFSAFVSFLSVVSISLGILNLLPVPLLDGGQVVYTLAEWIKGAPLSERAMTFGQQVGILLLMVLMGFAFYNDLTQMFS
jgi:regulator of sigma E protease